MLVVIINLASAQSCRYFDIYKQYVHNCDLYSAWQHIIMVDCVSVTIEDGHISVHINCTQQAMHVLYRPKVKLSQVLSEGTCNSDCTVKIIVC